MVTVGILAITSASAMVLSARSFNLLRSANESTLASQCLQERMEQLRGAGWTTLTSREIPEPDDDDTADDAADSTGDLTQEVLTETTEFPDDLSDVAESDPGLITLMAKALVSAADVKNPVENVTVAKYPEGSTPIKVRRNADGTTAIVSHNADLVYEDMVRVVLQFSWTSKTDGRTRTVGAQTIITKNTQ
jgi:hypothetical protein